MIALDEILLGPPSLAALPAALTAGRPSGDVVLARPGWPWLIAALARTSGAPLFVVSPGDAEARDLAAAIASLLGRSRVALWPTRGTAVGAVGASPHLIGLRARAMSTLGEEGRVVVAGIGALGERVPSAAARAQPISLALRDAVNGDLVDALVALGYERVDQVEGRGDLAARGDIVDVFPSTADLPIRVERFGDEVDGLRAFSPFTQRAIRPLERVLIWPAKEQRAAALVDPLDDPGLRGARVVRLAPHEHASALTAARERLEDEATSGALGDPELLLERLGRSSALDIAIPLDGRTPVFDAAEARFATRGVAEASAELVRQAAAGRRVVVAFDRRGDLERTERQLSRVNPVRAEADGPAPAPGKIAFVQLSVGVGLVSRDLGVVVVPAGAILRRARTAAAPTRPIVGKRLQSFLDLRVGDYVVHADVGLGRLIGFETRTVANVTRDYLTVGYAGSDVLYVPHDQLDKVTRYVGADASEPTLMRMGGKAWDRLKARARTAVREMAGELIALYEARGRIAGHAFPADDEMVAEFERRFPHEETPDQERAIDEVTEDMERARPMDRLICGDVGFGKTEIAMRAAFKAAVAGKQVLVLAPTTILAQQHLTTFRERMDAFPVSLDLVNRFRSPAETRDALARFRDGRLDIIIGTHRLLGMDVQPKDLGLVIVDEEQRFGVAQKEALRRLRTSVDVLAMSATPIPRTLQMSLAGLRDISVIETPPAGRQPIATHIGAYDEDLIRDSLKREADRGGQSFYLHNRVESIDEAAERIRGLVPELTVLVAHGRMTESRLEDVMLAFVRGDGDVLVATSIIESGLDIPQANTLIVERSDRLGLSQLYQIRGRVGRSNVVAHAYLLYPDEATLTHDAAARLRALADYTELGSGLRIAMRDLEIRGAGNLLGDEQSGHVAAVGFELYVEMLEEAMALRAGEAPVEEVRVDLPVSAHIPSTYVGFEAAKIDLHRRIAHAPDDASLSRLRSELADRFGPPPPPVEALLEIQSLKLSLRVMGVSQLAARGARIALAPVNLSSGDLARLRARLPGVAYSPTELTLTFPSGVAPAERLAGARELVDAVASIRAERVTVGAA